jgi:hypothetical protein
LHLDNKRKGVSAFGLSYTSFPLVCMFFGALLVLGQTATQYQAQNPYGISNVFLNSNFISPFTSPFNNQVINPNLNNITTTGSATIVPQQSSSTSCKPNVVLATSFFPFGLFLSYVGSKICGLVTSSSSIISSLFLGATVSSGTPQSVQIGFLTIVLFLMGAVLITGISIVGTGINTASIFLIFSMGGYVIIWLLLSTLAFPVFNGTTNSIPQPFGNLFFLILTGMYTFGIFERTL